VDKAIARLRELLTSGTTDPIVPLNLAVLLQQAGEPADAVAVYDTRIPHSHPATRFLP
jgi:hypothetical protein